MKHTIFLRALASLLFVGHAGQIPLAAVEPDPVPFALEPPVVRDAPPVILDAPPVEIYESQPFDEGKPIYESKRAGHSNCWTSRLGYVHLWREYTSDVPIVVPDIGGIPRFSSSEFDFDGRSGADFSVAWENGCGWGIDMRYLGVDEFNATEPFIPLDDPQIATRPPTDSLFDTGDLFVLDYTSQIQSFEVLGRRSLGRWGLTGGFRYIELNESLDLDIFDNPGNIFFEEAGFAAGNDLYGFQVGLDGPLWDTGGRFRVDGFTKFGIYYNDVQAGAYLDDPGDPLVSGTGVGADS